MFVQLLLGKVVDTEGMRRQWECWALALAPTAAGWLGSTGGVTADRRLLMSTTFLSAQASAENARRPEEMAWWSAAEACLERPATVLETEDVTVQRVSDVRVSDVRGAGFVQAMRAEVRDRARFEAIEAEIGAAFVELRPDFLVGYRLWFGDATLVALDYFRSEADARAGEAKEMPDDLTAGFQEWQSLVVAPEWYDLTRPWVATPM